MIESEEEEYSRDDLFYRVNSFLAKNRLGLGFAVTDSILDSVFINLSMDKDTFNSYELKEFKKFLNLYGSIRRSAFDIYKCELIEDEELDDEIRKVNTDTKVKAVTSTQILFHLSIKQGGINQKNYWLLAKDEDAQYCINLERNSNLGHIFCVDSSGSLVYFAENFSDFLDPLFNKHRKVVRK